METRLLPIFRSMNLGELLDQAIRMYRRNFLTFIGIIAVVYVPLTILQTAATTLMNSSLPGFMQATSPEELFTSYSYWVGVSSTVILVFLQFILVQGIAVGALTRAVADEYLGKKTGILDAYRGIRGSWLTLISALLFVGILFIIVSVWGIIVPCIGWFTGLGMAAFLLGAVNPLVAPVVVLERQSAVNAIQRAWRLARRRFWPVLGTVFVLYLLSLIIVNGPVVIVNIALVGMFEAFSDPTMQLVALSIIQALVSLVATLLYYPLQMTTFTLIYFDLRVRTEGLDIALQTAGATDSANAAEAIAAPIPQSDEQLVTGRDLGNFAILTLGATGVIIFFYTVIFAIIFAFASAMGM